MIKNVQSGEFLGHVHHLTGIQKIDGRGVVELSSSFGKSTFLSVFEVRLGWISWWWYRPVYGLAHWLGEQVPDHAT